MVRPDELPVAREIFAYLGDASVVSLTSCTTGQFLEMSRKVISHLYSPSSVVRTGPMFNSASSWSSLKLALSKSSPSAWNWENGENRKRDFWNVLEKFNHIPVRGVSNWYLSANFPLLCQGFQSNPTGIGLRILYWGGFIVATPQIQIPSVTS